MSDSSQWYMSIGGHHVGPISAQEMIANIRTGNLQPDSYVYTQGMQNWLRRSQSRQLPAEKRMK
ncbi:MAG: DUF4339 domain-containing protein [Acidobacteriota bacterium]